MPRLLQINVTANSGATGKITEAIGMEAIRNGWESYIAFGRGTPISQSSLLSIGNKSDVYSHALSTRLFDNHGLASKESTRRFIERIRNISPDIIHLHNIHGYYLNYQVLFRYLKEWNGPVVWTMHDCWAFTGHCAYFDNEGPSADNECMKWTCGCFGCPKRGAYPRSMFTDRSRKNFLDKRSAFTSLDEIHIITPSQWLASTIGKSFMSEYPRHVIHNGIDLNIFKPHKSSKPQKKIVLATAWVWTELKGLGDLSRLSELLPPDYQLCIIGLTPKQIKKLPKGIQGISRTENQQILARLYSDASVFVNPTYGDNFPTTNLEAIACGTPVVTYRTGGSPETIDPDTGRIVDRGDISGMRDAILDLASLSQEILSRNCRERAVRFFDQHERFAEYIDLYNMLLNR